MPTSSEQKLVGVRVHLLHNMEVETTHNSVCHELAHDMEAESTKPCATVHACSRRRRPTYTYCEPVLVISARHKHCTQTGKDKHKRSHPPQFTSAAINHKSLNELLACFSLNIPARLAVAPVLPGGLLTLDRAVPARTYGVSGAPTKIPQQVLRQQHQTHLATLHPAHASRLKLSSDIPCRAVHLHAPPPCISS